MSIGSLSVVGWGMLGVLPAVFWTLSGVYRATRRHERHFIRRGVVLVWTLVAVYLAALRVLPESQAAFVFLAYSVALLLAVALLEWRRTHLRHHDFPGSYLFTPRAPFGR